MRGYSLCSVHAASRYVATGGNDQTGDGSSGKLWKTIRRGIGGLTSGDTLVVRAGTNLGKPSFINKGLINIPDGSSRQYIEIRAETALGVR